MGRRKRERSRSPSSTIQVDPRLNGTIINVMLEEGKMLKMRESTYQEDAAFLHERDDDDDDFEGHDDIELGSDAALRSSSSHSRSPVVGARRRRRKRKKSQNRERSRSRESRQSSSRRGRSRNNDKKKKKDETTRQAAAKHRIGLFSGLILLIGGSSVALILTLGLLAARNDQEREFQQEASELTHQFYMASQDLLRVGLWVHHDASRNAVYFPGEVQNNRSNNATTSWTDPVSRENFHELYRSLVFSNVAAQSVGFAMNVSHADRRLMEEETRSFLQTRQDLKSDHAYQGFVGFNASAGEGQVDLDPFQQVSSRPENPDYLVQHLLEPLSPSCAIDFDFMSIPVAVEAVNQAMETWEPTVTSPFCTKAIFRDSTPGPSLLFFHPGVPPEAETHHTTNVMSHEQEQNPDDGHAHRPKGIAVLNVPVSHLFQHIGRDFSVKTPIKLYAYDTTGDEYLRLGAVRFQPVVSSSNEHSHGGGLHETEALNGMVLADDMVAYGDIVKDNDVFFTEERVKVASRTWTFVLVASEDDYPVDFTFIAIGASMIFVACLSLTLWLYADYRRMVKISQVQSASEAEKAALMVKNARLTARTERELNDFIAHEVRNPLSAALSACSFVSMALQEEDPLRNPEKKQEVEDDVVVIENSLHFINELLRSMLDLHKANSNQLKLNPTPTSVLSDILQPVASMLYKRGENFTVQVECNPPDMVIMADTLRLKQIVLNLGRNAVKFVEKGFVRLRATRNDLGNVCIFIEDSGPGIPVEKRGKLFNKFQESLDSLHQGTGIGLAVCRKLIDLMGGEIGLNESYHSGIEGCPGASFIINLNTPTISISDEELEQQQKEDGQGHPVEKQSSAPIPGATAGVGSVLESISENEEDRELPEKLSVLFVDDDMMVRKLFVRSLKRVAPSWDIKEASNGETGFQMAETENFHLIFLDQYMASVDKQWLGTETAMAMRAAGINATICGLSANDIEKAFIAAGANSFMMKPFPCAPPKLKAELLVILDSGNPISESKDKGPDTEPSSAVVKPELLQGQTFQSEESEQLQDEV